MTYKDICSKQVYCTKNNEEKTRWLKVGTLKETGDGKQFIELNIAPNTPFYVFARKEKEEKPQEWPEDQG